MDSVADMPADFFDIDLFNLDDFDLAADEFCDAYAAFVADPDINKGAASPGGWLAGLGINAFATDTTDEGSSSPDSGVTDGPFFAGEEGGSLSAYVCDLERFLLESDDDAVVDEEGAEEEISSVVDDYFGDLLVAVEADAAGNADEGSLDAREDDQEPTSRKRARHKIRGTAMTPCSWGELEVTRRHLARIGTRLMISSVQNGDDAFCREALCI